MESGSIGMLIALVLLVAGSAFFSSTETAFSSLNRIRLKNQADEGSKRAAATLALADDYDRLLSTILIGNNIVNIAAASISTVLFTQLLGGARGPTVATVVLTAVILIFGEISPKSLAKESPEAVAMAVTPVIRAFMVLLKPVNALFTLWKGLLTRLFHTSGGDAITEGELITMVDQAETEGGLDQRESQLIRAAIEFNDLEVAEVLVPRVDIVAAEDTVTAAELAALFAESGYSRIPIYHETIDNIVGVVHEKDLHAARYRGRETLDGIVSQVLCTTASTKISDLLQILQRSKAHMVIVVDEYGGTEGLATLEDILEELVGEIWDEHDEVVEEFKKQEDGSYLISCSANLTGLFDLFSIRGECDCTTVSGWVMSEIGRVPVAGDRFTYENLDVTVTKLQHRRVLEIQVRVLPSGQEE
ncbi:MAG: HlyC/CorC family transporter [Oscillospiraceae bacterium]|nr:HlyC/CorC family transporter [Oscillospiraceae bacterium]